MYIQDQVQTRHRYLKSVSESAHFYLVVSFEKGSVSVNPGLVEPSVPQKCVGVSSFILCCQLRSGICICQMVFSRGIATSFMCSVLVKSILLQKPVQVIYPGTHLQSRHRYLVVRDLCLVLLTQGPEYQARPAKQRLPSTRKSFYLRFCAKGYSCERPTRGTPSLPPLLSLLISETRRRRERWGHSVLIRTALQGPIQVLGQ